MKLTATSGGSYTIGSNAEITAINLSTKTLTLSAASSLANNSTLTFRAYGTRLIKSAIGISLNLSNPTVRLGQVTTSVRAEITSDLS